MFTTKQPTLRPDRVKRGIIKGYSDKARVLCDPEYLEEELGNIKEVFKENGYTENEIENAMKERKRSEMTEAETAENESEPTHRGIVVIENIPNVTPQFNKIAREHGFRVANKSGTRVRDLTSKAKTPLGDKNSCVSYNIPCGCNKYPYNGETN